jgi:hypothetical protein
MVQLQVEVEFLKDQLRGDEVTEIRVSLIRMMDEQAPIDDE